MKAQAAAVNALSRQGAEHVKILAVDDDRDNLLALQAVLEPLEQDVMLAESGKDALRLCLNHDFAAILLDVRMPEMDGFETAELIRSRNRSRQTPILFLTAYRSDEQLFRGYDLGAVDFLFKPIVPEILQSKVSVFVELSRAAQMLRLQSEHLAQAERKFRAVLEAAPDAMVITDPEGIIELANSRMDELFGHSRSTLIGENLRAMIPQWECPSLEESQEFRTETRLTAVRLDGSRFPAQITRSVFRIADRPSITTAIRDASSQVESETRIQRINAELEKRVADRTAELTRSNDALRQFAWAASHDFQEPIRTVLAYSRWLAEAAAHKLSPEEAQMLGFIEEHSARMHRLLEALQQYIRVSESAKKGWSPVDCNAAAGTAIANLQKLIDETGAQVACRPLPVISSVEILIVQLFQNLIENGIKYRAEGRTPVIRIWAERSGQDWLFSIQDNGIGIAEKHRNYIFGVFRRLHGADHAGTGIGLALCQAAVERLNGRIWVESELGRGSIFRFSIPQESNSGAGED
jgi:PAS domain S-box-containing protein